MATIIVCSNKHNHPVIVPTRKSVYGMHLFLVALLVKEMHCVKSMGNCIAGLNTEMCWYDQQNIFL